MKILVPLPGKDHLQDYIEAGADELYFGFHDDKWSMRFGKYADINRMSGFGKRANPMKFEEALDVVDAVHQGGAAAYVTLNSAFYSVEQTEYLRRFMEPLKRMGVDGVIVSCPELVAMAAEYDIPTVASTMCGIYNSDLAAFYSNLGISRMILPRDLSPEELKNISDCVPDVEYEVFLMRNGCVFSDSNCLCVHRPERGALCGSLRRASRKMISVEKDFDAVNEFELNDLLYSRFFHQGACGLCAVYRLEKMGIAAGKIVGRADDWQRVCDDIRLAKANTEIAVSCSSEEEYLKKMVFPGNRYELCKMGMNCYYPEIRF